MAQVEKDKRKEYIDILRCLACFGVVFYHVAGQCWNSTEFGGSEWKVFCIYANLTLWPVFSFVMISGTCFLSRECSIKKLYKHNIFKLFVVYAFWDIVYAALQYFKTKDNAVFFNNIINGHYHLWFIPMLIGLYFLVPLLKKIVESSQLTIYFLLLAFIFAVALPQLIKLLSLFNDKCGSNLNIVFSKLDFHFAIGFVGYFVLGYWIDKLDIKGKERKFRIICWFIFIILSLLAALLPVYVNQAEGLFGNYSLLVVLKSSAVYLGIKAGGGNFLTHMDISSFSRYSFAIYLVHPLVIESLNEMLKLNTLTFNPVLSVPVISTIVFIISLFISVGLNKLPIIGKYLV